MLGHPAACEQQGSAASASPPRNNRTSAAAVSSTRCRRSAPAGDNRPDHHASGNCAATSGSAEPEAKLRGVPLSTLAACRSDRREDSLKLAVLGAVGDRRECASAAGTYRFVETKNLNAFLMWIERAPGRAAVDRCAELTHALSCLSGPGAK